MIAQSLTVNPFPNSFLKCHRPNPGFLSPSVSLNGELEFLIILKKFVIFADDANLMNWVYLLCVIFLVFINFCCLLIVSRWKEAMSMRLSRERTVGTTVLASKEQSSSYNSEKKRLFFFQIRAYLII